MSAIWFKGACLLLMHKGACLLLMHAFLLAGQGFLGQPLAVKRRAWGMVLECLDREWLPSDLKQPNACAV